LLPPDYFTGGTPKAEILAILPDTPEKAGPVKFNGSNGLMLINAILATNRESSLFFDQKKLAKAGIQKYTMQNRLLLHQEQLIVSDENFLRIRLYDEFHQPPYKTYPGCGKFRKMVFQQYFWPGMGSFIDHYIRNCPKYMRNRNSRLKPAELLRPLPVPQKPWQHITMDFKFFN
jgi:hypothetical protein